MFIFGIDLGVWECGAFWGILRTSPFSNIFLVNLVRGRWITTCDVMYLTLPAIYRVITNFTQTRKHVTRD